MLWLFHRKSDLLPSSCKDRPTFLVPHLLAPSLLAVHHDRDHAFLNRREQPGKAGEGILEDCCEGGRQRGSRAGMEREGARQHGLVKEAWGWTFRR